MDLLVFITNAKVSSNEDILDLSNALVDNTNSMTLSTNNWHPSHKLADRVMFELQNKSLLIPHEGRLREVESHDPEWDYWRDWAKINNMPIVSYDAYLDFYDETEPDPDSNYPEHAPPIISLNGLVENAAYVPKVKRGGHGKGSGIRGPIPWAQPKPKVGDKVQHQGVEHTITKPGGPRNGFKMEIQHPNGSKKIVDRGDVTHGQVPPKPTAQTPTPQSQPNNTPQPIQPPVPQVGQAQPPSKPTAQAPKKGFNVGDKVDYNGKQHTVVKKSGAWTHIQGEEGNPRAVRGKDLSHSQPQGQPQTPTPTQPKSAPVSPPTTTQPHTPSPVNNPTPPIHTPTQPKPIASPPPSQVQPITIKDHQLGQHVDDGLKGKIIPTGTPPIQQSKDDPKHVQQVKDYLSKLNKGDKGYSHEIDEDLPEVPKDLIGRHLSDLAKRGDITLNPVQDVSKLSPDKQRSLINVDGKLIRSFDVNKGLKEEKPNLPNPSQESKISGPTLVEKLKSYQGADQAHQAMLDHGDKIEKLRNDLEDKTKQHGKLTSDVMEMAGIWKSLTKEQQSGLDRSALTKLEDQHRKLTSDLLEARSKLEASVKQSRDILLSHLKPEQGEELKINIKPASEETTHNQMSKANEALQFIHGVTSKGDNDREDLNKIQIAHISDKDASKGSRAHYSNVFGLLYTEDHDVTSTYVHEMGHHLEDKLGGLQQAAQGFIEHRCKDEKPVKLAELFPSAGFRDDEYGRKDNFDKLFAKGNPAAPYYVGKVYPGGSTEVISMGIEQLHKDPTAMAQKDPEYFKFMVGALKGHLR